MPGKRSSREVIIMDVHQTFQVIYVHLFIELFYKDFSLFVKTNYETCRETYQYTTRKLHSGWAIYHLHITVLWGFLLTCQNKLWSISGGLPIYHMKAPFWLSDLPFVHVQSMMVPFINRAQKVQVYEVHPLVIVTLVYCCQNVSFTPFSTPFTIVFSLLSHMYCRVIVHIITGVHLSIQ